MNAWSELPPEAMVEVLKSDELCITEVALLSAVLSWAKAELGRQKKEDSKENIKALLDEKKIIQQIRFPLFTVDELAREVQPAGLIDTSNLLKLFKFAAAKDESDRADIQLEFSRKPRKGKVHLKFKIRSLSSSSNALTGTLTINVSQDSKDFSGSVTWEGKAATRLEGSLRGGNLEWVEYNRESGAFEKNVICTGVVSANSPWQLNQGGQMEGSYLSDEGDWTGRWWLESSD